MKESAEKPYALKDIRHEHTQTVCRPCEKLHGVYLLNPM